MGPPVRPPGGGSASSRHYFISNAWDVGDDRQSSGLQAPPYVKWVTLWDTLDSGRFPRGASPTRHGSPCRLGANSHNRGEGDNLPTLPQGTIEQWPRTSGNDKGHGTGPWTLLYLLHSPFFFLSWTTADLGDLPLVSTKPGCRCWRSCEGLNGGMYW